jgi:hypothetical protein
MNHTTRRILRDIFHEAQVIDFDWSCWDRYVRLVVIAWIDGTKREPLYNLDFSGVKTLNWQSTHLGVRLEADQHCQWHIIEGEIERLKRGYLIKIRGIEPAPMIMIECEDVMVSRRRRRVVDEIVPDWGGAYQPLARGGFEELQARLKRRKSS